MTQDSITCPRCGMTSYNPNDIAQGYCGNCHDWTGRPAEGVTIPVNPCVACWRVRHLLIPAEWVATNKLRTIVLCNRCYNEFQEMDQDHRGEIHTKYRQIAPGEHITIEGGKGL